MTKAMLSKAAAGWRIEQNDWDVENSAFQAKYLKNYLKHRFRDGDMVADILAKAVFIPVLSIGKGRISLQWC